MRLIDADELIEFIENRYEITWDSETYEGGIKDACSDILEKIDNTPIIDAVPVVHCKDCKHGYVIDTGVEVFNMCRLNYIIGQVDGWFCADGKRRDNDPTQTQHVESVGQHTQDVGMR